MLVFDQLKKNDPQLRLLAFGVFCGMLVLLAGLWWVQIVSSRDYQAHLETQSFKTVRMPAPRGKILDRNGVVLAENRPNYSIGLYLEDLSSAFRSEYKRLRPTRVVTNSLPFWKRWLGASAVVTQYVRLNSEQRAALERQARYNATSRVVQRIALALQHPLTLDPADFHKQYYQSRAMPYPIIKTANETDILRFEEQLSGKIAADLDVQSVRVYPFGTTAAHVLGELHRNDNRSFEGEDAAYDYRLPDYSGVQGTGIEHAFDEQLRGRAGTKSVLVNSSGYRQSEDILMPVQPGHNVVLTIDLAIQRATEAALRNAPVTYAGPVRGAAIVMDVHSGDILAMASSPTLDPNNFITGFTQAEWRYVNDTNLNVQVNRATQKYYAPGSIFKTMIGLACLENGMDPSATIYNPPSPGNPNHGYIHVGRDIGDLAPPGLYDFRRAIMESCNTYFITNGLKVGMPGIMRLVQHLHLNERLGLNTRQEVAGRFPTMERIQRGWSVGETALLCIGQGEIAVTPLQMAVMTCALANGGTVLWPRLVAEIKPQDPTSDEPPTFFPMGRVRDHLGVNQRNLRVLQEAMRAEVLEGTGKNAQVPGMDPCGKTGTAEVTDSRGRKDGQNTWFISYAPYEQPRYAVVVLVEGGRYGGSTCAPVAKQIYEAILKSQRINAAKTGTLARTK